LTRVRTLGRDSLRAVGRDGVRRRSTDESRQLVLCQIMWWMRHLVLGAALVAGVVTVGFGRTQVLIAVALTAEVVSHVVVRRNPERARVATIIDAFLLVTMAVLGMPGPLVLVMSVGVLGWAATFRPIPAIATGSVALSAVALSYLMHGSSFTTPAAVGGYCLLGAIFLVRTIRMNMGARRASEREELVAEGIAAILWEADPATGALKVSLAAERVLGHPVSSWAQPGFIETIVHPDDLPAVQAQMTGPCDHSVTVRLRHANGSLRWMENRCNWVRDRTGRLTFAVGVMLDVTDRVDAGHQLHAQARQDYLTGLPNRRAFIEVLEELIESGQTPAVVILDLDDFKDINDSLGHETGDQLLVQIGHTIVGGVGASDVVARLGGDEFAIVLSSGDEVAAMRRAVALVERINQPVLVGDLRLRVRASAGVATVAGLEGELSAAELVRCADVAMYVAKSHGSGAEVYVTGTDRFDRQRLSLVAELDVAIAEGQLVLHHQPLIDVTTNAVVGTEVLARWNHPTMGLIPPDVFIELAEVSGQMKNLTRWVIRRALGDLIALGADGDGLDVSVNLSVRNLYEADLVDWLTATFTELDISPTRLVVEITETTMMDDQSAAIEVIESLRRLGVRTWIDDFGTGHSSFARLRNLPVDGVKIDRTFVSGSAISGNDQILLRSLVELLHSLGLQTIAEGVEEIESMDLLRRMGCDMAQGFALARPMPFDELARTLRRAPALIR
jgi:diguanylate cyclase (GGDEF)-like protein/PAS domain S-box-containing protein